MNTEGIQLNMTPGEADKIAYVLMSALRKVGMLDSERKVSVAAANELFKDLGYRVRTGSYGEHIELGEDGKPLKMVCEHPGVFAPDDLDIQEVQCHTCGKVVPVSQL